MARWNIILFLIGCCLVAGCDADTQAVARCGDQYLDPGEECDGSQLQGASCRSLGFYSLTATLGCTADCRYDTSGCGPACGDSVVDGLQGEACDGSNLNGQDCESLGFSGGSLICGDDCRFDTAACQSVCGDNVVGPDEGCDDGNFSDGDGCSQTCEVEPGWNCTDDHPSICSTICGDGMQRGEEECDQDEFAAGGTCIEEGYWSGTLSCSEDCRAVSECHTVRAVSAGGDHTCVAAGEGGAYCWGRNAFGQLGTGSLLGSRVPVRVQGLTAVVNDIQAGEAHTCAVTDAGQLWCWGRNDAGQLGDGSTTDRPLPVPVIGFSTGTVLVSLGHGHTCAAKSDGGVWCWGRNDAGQLGDGSTTDRVQPVAVGGVSGVELLACGGTHTCVTKVDDSIWCWGGNASGQLGVGDQTARPVPVEVMGLFGDVYDLDAGGNHTCVSVESYLYCWGSNQYGQLGDGTTIDRVWPVEVSSIQDERIAAGDRHTCSSDYEQVHCWGDNSDGQLGDGTTVSSSVPVRASSYSGNMVTLGNAHSCQDADGEPSSWPVCWGRNADGQVGDGGTASVLSPVEVLAPAAP